MSSSIVSPAEAREALPVLSWGNVKAALRVASNGETPQDSQVDLLYLHHLISRGNLAHVRDFLDGFSDVERRHLVNATDYHTHFGNTLHTCAYWNTGVWNEETGATLEMFDFLVECGAKPIRNFYENLPWEQKGIVYVPVVPNVCESMVRKSDDFADTYTYLKVQYEDIVDPAIREPDDSGTWRRIPVIPFHPHSG